MFRYTNKYIFTNMPNENITRTQTSKHTHNPNKINFETSANVLLPYVELKKNYSSIHKTLNCTFAISSHLLMMAQERQESNWEPVKYGKFVNQFQPDIKTTIWRFERIEMKICRQTLSVILDQMCLNEEMLPKSTLSHTHTHTHIYIYCHPQTDLFRSIRTHQYS